MCVCVWCCFFVFKHKTAYELRISDWSSDVCSSDLRFVRSALHASDNQDPPNSGGASSHWEPKSASTGAGTRCREYRAVSLAGRLINQDHLPDRKSVV